MKKGDGFFIETKKDSILLVEKINYLEIPVIKIPTPTPLPEFKKKLKLIELKTGEEIWPRKRRRKKKS